MKGAAECVRLASVTRAADDDGGVSPFDHRVDDGTCVARVLHGHVNRQCMRRALPCLVNGSGRTTNLEIAVELICVDILHIRAAEDRIAIALQ